MASISDKQIRKIDSLANALGKAAASLPGKSASRTTWETYTDGIKSALAKLEDELPFKEGLSIGSFIEQFGEGVVNAQEELDKKSKAYLSKLQSRDEINVALPSLYRIPKASAELSFSMEYEKERGFNLFVYGKKDTRTERQQQKISFDIVAAPPPAELMDALSLGEIDIAWILNIIERTQILAIVEQHHVAESNALKKEQIAILKNNFDRTLIFRKAAMIHLIRPFIAGGRVISATIEGGRITIPSEMPSDLPETKGSLLRILADTSSAQEKFLQAAKKPVAVG